MHRIIVQTPVDVKIYYSVQKTAQKRAVEATEPIIDVTPDESRDALFRWGILGREPLEDWARRMEDRQMNPFEHEED